MRAARFGFHSVVLVLSFLMYDTVMNTLAFDPTVSFLATLLAGVSLPGALRAALFGRHAGATPDAE